MAAWLASASALIASPVLAGEPHFPSPMGGWTGDSGLSAGNGPMTVVSHHLGPQDLALEIGTQPYDLPDLNGKNLRS